MHIIHISDLHILPKEHGTIHGINTAHQFERVVHFIHGMPVHPDLFILSGDLCEDGSRQGYLYLKRVLRKLEPFNAPVLLGLGNHDGRRHFREVLLGEKQADENQPYYYSRDCGDFKILMLDSKVPDCVHGELCEEQLAWLRRELSNGSAGPSLLVMHHPPKLRGETLMKNWGQLEEILRTGKVIGILSGHTHLHGFQEIYGIPSVIAPAASFTIRLSNGSRQIDQTCGFNWIIIQDSKMEVMPIVV